MEDFHAFSKMLASKLFMAGTFFQLDWFNPLYLDKTGLAIAQTEGRLKDWGGTLNAFLFVSVDGTYSGKVSIQNYWIQIKKQEYFEPDFIELVRNRVLDDVKVWTEVYDVRHISRIGLRTQAIFEKYTDVNLKAYNNLLRSSIDIAPESDLKTSNVSLEIPDKGYTARIGVSWATKQNTEMSGPERGFLLDIDLHKTFNKQRMTWAELESELKAFFSYCGESYLRHVSNSLNLVGSRK